ncbi:MAG TPA: trypsin-like peptidase domain-containing protein [Dermatophilaceae bacterium]|nr:trypsin-like peptidase domain-containing protein [Dermatophilaceae bacterium]
MLASGGTYALTRADDPASATGTTGTSVATNGQTTSAPKVVQAAANAPDWAATAAAVAPSVVAITVESDQGSGQGSGVIFDSAGHIVTNNHVVSGAGSGAALTVTLNDSRSYPATVVGTDPATDLAVIKLRTVPKDLKPISLGNDNDLSVGDPVMAVGNPLGLAGTVTTGIVSALNRPVTTQAQEQPTDPFGRQSAAADTVVTNAVQTSAAINPGNSGGALVDANGLLVGINSSIAQLGGTGGQGGNIGIGFAIPVNEAKSIADQLIKSGKAEHAFLGVSSQDATVKDGGASRAAAQLTAVTPGSAAAQAGLQAGDSIVAVDGEPIDGSLSLVAQIRERSVGTQAKLTVIRDGQRQDVTVTLGRKA